MASIASAIIPIFSPSERIESGTTYMSTKFALLLTQDSISVPVKSKVNSWFEASLYDAKGAHTVHQLPLVYLSDKAQESLQAELNVRINLIGWICMKAAGGTHVGFQFANNAFISSVDPSSLATSAGRSSGRSRTMLYNSPDLME